MKYTNINNPKGGIMIKGTKASLKGTMLATFEIRLNGKSTGWFGNHKDCVEVLSKLDNQRLKLTNEIEKNTGLGDLDQNYEHNVNARHLTFTHQNDKARVSRSGTYKNAYIKTIANTNTGKTVFGFDGFVDVWTVKEV